MAHSSDQSKDRPQTPPLDNVHFDDQASPTLKHPKKKSFKAKNITLTTTTVLRIPQDGSDPELIELSTVPSYFAYVSNNKSDAHLLHIPYAISYWGYSTMAWDARTVVYYENSEDSKPGVVEYYYVLFNMGYEFLPKNEHVRLSGAKNSDVYGDIFIFKIKDQDKFKGELGEAEYEDVDMTIVENGMVKTMLLYATEGKVEVTEES